MTQLVPLFSLPSEPFSLKRSYWTDVITSRSGKEHRRANRTFPRRHVEFTTPIADSTWLKYRRFLMTGQRDFAILADETRRIKLTSITTTDLVPESIPDWLVPGMYLVLADYVNKVYGTALVDSIAAGHVTLHTAPGTFAAGSYIYAGIRGWLDPNVTYDNIFNKVATAKVAFDEDPQFYIAEPSRTAWATFNSRECWVFPPNKFNPITVTSTAEMESVDFSFHRLENFDIYGYTDRMFSGSWSIREEEAEQVRAFFDRMFGQQGEFYMPTWEADLTVKTTATAGTNTLTFAGPEVYNLYHGSTFFTAVCVYRDDLRIPTLERNKVTSIALSGGDSVITFENNWAANVTTATKISWMPVWRLATDNLELTWNRGPAGDVVASFNQPMKMVEDLEVETPYPPHRYWRLTFTTNDAARTQYEIGELKMYSEIGGADITAGKTYSAVDTGIFGDGPDKAFDGNPATFWVSQLFETLGWIGVDFGTAVPIVQFKVTASTADYTWTPTQYTLQYSDDNVIWTDYWTSATSTGWTSGEERTFTPPA